MSFRICAVAVDVSTYTIDKLYDYLLPEPFASAAVGCRVLVPFGRGNKRAEGIILAFRNRTLGENEKLKNVLQVLDETPVLSDRQIKLAIHMRDRLYCRFFDCIHAILPNGLWFEHRDTYTLEKQPDHTLTAAQQRVLSLFSESIPSQTIDELRTRAGFTVSEQSLRELCNMGYLSLLSESKRRARDKVERRFTLCMNRDDAFSLINARRSPAQLDVVSCLEDGSCMTAKELNYMTGISDSTLRTMVKKGILTSFEAEAFRLPDFTEFAEVPLPTLNNEQEAAFSGLSAMLDDTKPHAALLYGVTGSGKTQVYLRLIDRALKQGKSAILLVPEIGLTPQLIRIIAGCFPAETAVLHSALAPGERYDSWKKIRSGDARVILGTRSAILAPAVNLGLIIIDEEQDSAYRSEQTPRYHARDIARYRAGQENTLLVLGSATPSVETFYRVREQNLPMFKLEHRYKNARLPQVIIADRRNELPQQQSGMIGPVLFHEIEEMLERKEQGILFLNRRGNSRKVGCAVCGWVPECPYCSTTMTFHSANMRLMCHLCGASMKMGENCPECGSEHMFTEQPGTQHVEEELHRILPHARVLRMDADTTAAKNAHDKLIESFRKHRADLLLGTQMVTKGLDFENVTLVGVLDADQSLFAQDYQARERTFSLITQVVGRAGRSEREGRAVIQTANPDHPIILNAARQDYNAFYEQEIEQRSALMMPPIEDFVMLTGVSEFESPLIDTMIRLKFRIVGLMEGQFSDFRYPVLGPAPASIVRVAGKFRYHLVIRCPNTPRRRELITGILLEFARARHEKTITLFAENDPIGF